VANFTYVCGVVHGGQRGVSGETEEREKRGEKEDAI